MTSGISAANDMAASVGGKVLVIMGGIDLPGKEEEEGEGRG